MIRIHLTKQFNMAPGDSGFLVFQIGLDVRTVGQVSSWYIPQTVLLMNSFIALHWIMEQVTTPAPSNAM